MSQATRRFLQIETIFHEALDAPEDTRKSLVETRCNFDRGLASEVFSLLEACRAEERLTSSRRSNAGAGPALEAGKRVGPYELDRLLGRGGMGAVYLAHRADGQFDQQVAIKLIDLPLTTELFRERFRQERQILAGLQHPYIARLLDGGISAEGELYLAMEYVAGVPIHQYCNAQNLSIRQRIEVFLRACEAVQFAHQNFVVHRDLKPDNILVAEDGTPRLLDFGTAKLLSPSLARPHHELTREGYLSFTPQYASPEQVLGKPITAASDTYSLGVLLYLLLTGEPPYELKELSTAEMVRVICQEPVRRAAHTAGSAQRLHADLVAILAKALRKEPRERYLTAEQLANDLQAHLAGRPVAARRGTLRYRAGKFILRNRIGLTAAVLLAVSLIAGIAGIVWQARVANRERRMAEARSADLRQLSNSLLSELDEAIKQLPGSTGAQKLLVTRVLEHLDRMAKDAQGDRQTQLDLVDAYQQLGNLQGNTYAQNLGDPLGALASLDKAIALAEPLVARDSHDRQALRALALAQLSRGQVLSGMPRVPEALASMRTAIATYERLVALPGASAPELCEASNSYTMLGDTLGDAGSGSLGDQAGAIAAYREADRITSRALTLDPNLMRARRGIIINQLKIGEAEMPSDPAQARKDFQAALERNAALPQKEQETLRMIRVRDALLRDQADVLIQLGAYDEANRLFAGVAPSFQKLSAADPRDMRALADLQNFINDWAAGYEAATDPVAVASAEVRRHNLAEAEKLLVQDVVIVEKIRKQSPSDEEWVPILADAQVRLGSAQSRLHASPSALALTRTGMAGLKTLAAQGHASPTVLNQAARAFLNAEPASLRDLPYAIITAERAVAASHRGMPDLLLTLAQTYRASGQTDKARATAREALTLLPATPAGTMKPLIRKLLEREAE